MLTYTLKKAPGVPLYEALYRSYPKRGFFVEQTELCRPRPRQPEGMPAEAPETLSFDLTGSAPGDFPFTVWSRLERQVMLDVGTALLKPLPNQGAPELRRAIADHLFQFIDRVLQMASPQ